MYRLYLHIIYLFQTDLEYKDYEELIEDIIFNLVNSINIDETNKTIALYQREHLQQIAEDQSRRQFEIDQVIYCWAVLLYLYILLFAF
jgi:hypothetical protein